MATKKVAQVSEPTNDNIIDIDFAAVRKSRFRINGDNSKILELNTSDIGIVARVQDTYPKLAELQGQALSADSEEDDMEAFSNKLSEIDGKMRELVNYVFDADVCSVCASDGTMYDPIEGKFRYEHILDKLFSLYEQSLDKEFRLMKARINKYAKK